MQRIIKKIFDLTSAIVLIAIFSPLLVVISLLNLIILGSPVFFFQVRIGQFEKAFKIFKFRSMLIDESIPEADRIPQWGKFLRNSSLDELPQLFNVLKGDLSLVGPRPLLPEYLPLYNEEQKKRHLVLPGITGWAQVNGRNAISWKEKFELDVWYVQNQSFLLDMKILFLTFLRVISPKDVNSSSTISMQKFNGKN